MSGPTPFRAGDAGVPAARWSASSVAIGTLVAAVSLIAGVFVVAIFDPDLESIAATQASQLVVAAALIGTAVGFALSDETPGKVLAKLGLRRPTLSALGLGALGWLVYVVIAVVLSPLLQPEQEDVTRELGTDTGSVIGVGAAALLVCVLAPLSEELFFRGFAFAGLRRSLSFIPAALISALIWGLLHLGPANIGVVVQLALFGIVLAYLYERSGSLWPPLVAHTINNALAFAVLLSGGV